MSKSNGQVAERLRRVALVEVDQGIEGVETSFARAHAAYERAEEAKRTEVDRISTLIVALVGRRSKLEKLK